MGRKPTITAVPVEPKQEGLVDDEVKTDAEQMTEIINEVNVDEEPVLVQEYIPAPKAKARPKRAPKKQEVIVPEVEVTSAFDEVEAVVTVPDELKVETKVTCPDCGKQMSAKTLRYSHGPNCSVKKQKPEPPSVIEEVIENEVQKRLLNSRAIRAARRQDMVDKLMQNAF